MSVKSKDFIFVKKTTKCTKIHFIDFYWQNGCFICKYKDNTDLIVSYGPVYIYENENEKKNIIIKLEEKKAVCKVLCLGIVKTTVEEIIQRLDEIEEYKRKIFQ